MDVQLTLPQIYIEKEKLNTDATLRCMIGKILAVTKDLPEKLTG